MRPVLPIRVPVQTLAVVIATLTAAAGVSAAAEPAIPIRAPEALPGATVGMNNPIFWIARLDNPDTVLMTPAEIAAFNARNATRTVSADHPYAANIAEIEAEGPTLARMDPLALGDSYDAAPVAARLETNRRQLADRTFYDHWALPFTEQKKTEILTAMSLNRLPGTIIPRTGMIVRHTSARLFPTAEPGYRMRGYLDNINVTSLDAGMPVAVLHVSAAGDFLFAMTPIAWGWVPAADVAFGKAADIRTFREDGQFIVATAHRAPVYADEACSVHAGWLYMGERLPFDHKSAAGFRVRVPVRRFDGSLGFEQGWVRERKGVHEGWPPYTQRNVLSLAFRLMGRPYGWHDSWDERDCGGIMRVILGCFGIELPRYWSFEQVASDRATFVGDIADTAEKNRLLASMPAGATLTGSTGHIGLYIGTVDGKPYALHQCGWNYTVDGVEYKMARVVVSDYDLVNFEMAGIKFFTPVLPE